MRFATRCLVPLVALATITFAQTLPHFQHIISIVQENRTPDHLFGSGGKGSTCGSEDPFEPGVDIENGGPAKGKGIICLTPLHLYAGFDPNHTYENGWLPQYDNGQLDGACENAVYNPNEVTLPPCPQYTYVIRSDVQPYFDIATNYGFANYMFQTNEGPSFPAHQFLFTGTSAPTYPNDPSGYGIDFVAENDISFSDSGCADTIEKPPWVDPTGNEPGLPKGWGLQCYPHDSLVTNSSGDKGVSWRYYTPTPGVIWNAPAAIPEVCYGTNNGYPQGQLCNSPEWTNHISIPAAGTPGAGAPILADIQNCKLQQISWVIPDQVWSDHPESSDGPYGPSWVGNIVDAIGNSWTQSLGGGKCDYWGNNTNDTTAIFITWDDWGGWFDHVLPPHVYRSTDPTTCPTDVQANGWGCGYVYGFRVPLLVVSQYTPAGYVSGACTGNCPNNKFPYIHDFGSILAFTEYNFGMQPIDQSGDKGYADFNAPDWSTDHMTHVPLSDFFNATQPRSFTPITVSYPASLFENYYNPSGNSPTGPDGDESD